MIREEKDRDGKRDPEGEIQKIRVGGGETEIKKTEIG